MKHNDDFYTGASKMEHAVSLCGGSPRGDELPQVGSVDDMLLDICSDIMNMPREYAAARLHHQWTDDSDRNGAVH